MEMYEIYYRSGGLFRVLKAWFENDLDYSVEKMTEIVYNLAKF